MKMMRLADDSDLILRIKNRDEGALAATMEKYSAKVFSAAFRVLRQSPDAQEVTQDVFWALWRSPERFDGARGALVTWLVILSRSRALDLLRRIHPSAEITNETLHSPALSQRFTRDGNLLVEELLLKLPIEQRCVVQKVYLEGYALREVAELQDTPLGTVKGRARVAIKKMRSELSN